MQRTVAPWLILSLCACAPDVGADPGAVATCDRPVASPWRRLTARELDRALEGLLGVFDLPPLPPDPLSHGYDMLAAGQPISDVLLGALLRAVEDGTHRALVTPRRAVALRAAAPVAPQPQGRAHTLGDTTWWTLIAPGDDAAVQVVFTVDTAGTYRVLPTLTWLSGSEAERAAPMVRWWLDDQRQPDVLVGTTVGYPVPDEDLGGPHALTAGVHTVKIAMAPEEYDEDTAAPAPSDVEDPVTAALLANATVVGVGAVRVEGPVIAGTPSAAAVALAPCDLEGAACRRGVIEAFAMRAWRHAPTSERVDALEAVADDALARGRYPDQAVALALEAVLLSPRFLFAVEGAGPLAGDALATRLALLVWGDLPDAALLDDAEAGRLDTPEGLAAALHRLFADPKVRGFADGFGRGWLGTGNPARGALGEAFDREAGILITGALSYPGPAAAALLGPNPVADPTLRAHYGDTTRPGVLGLGAVLSATSPGGTTSPPRRGAWVLERLVCDPVGAPPANVSPLPEEAAGDNPLHVAAAHARQDACASCHRRIDPLGLALERYDATGSARAEWPDGTPIPTVALEDGEEIEGPEGLAAALRDDPRFITCVASHLLTVATSALHPADSCTVAGIAQSATSSSLAGLIEAVVVSEAFRTREVAP
jgi:hypothetical protein